MLAGLAVLLGDGVLVAGVEEGFAVAAAESPEVPESDPLPVGAVAGLSARAGAVDFEPVERLSVL